MRIGFLVNRLETERERFTTTHLAAAALRLGHEVAHIPVAALTCEESGRLTAAAVTSEAGACSQEIIAALRDPGQQSVVDVSALDLLWLRNDPAADVTARPWARLAGINFGRLAVQAGVKVINDPDGLAHAVNKMYLHLQPPHVRPRSLITRSGGKLLDFAESCGGRIVVKPLHGSGGHGVFMIRLDFPDNINQIIETLRPEGFILAQEYLPEAAEGDIRLFVLHGEILRVSGNAAAVRRRRRGGDLRNNISAGGVAEGVDVTPAMEALVRDVRPRLKADGMALVGLDVVGDKLMEINVFSPGALVSAAEIYDTDFFTPIIESVVSARVSAA